MWLLIPPLHPITLTAFTHHEHEHHGLTATLKLQGKDAARIRDFILKHSPHLIVVGTAGPEAVQLIRDIKRVSDDILENNARFLTTSDTGASVSTYMLTSSLQGVR